MRVAITMQSQSNLLLHELHHENQVLRTSRALKTMKVSKKRTLHRIVSTWHWHTWALQLFQGHLHIGRQDPKLHLCSHLGETPTKEVIKEQNHVSHNRPNYNAICRDWVAKHNRTTRNGVGNCSSKTGWISTPERKKDDFETLFKMIFRRKIISAKMEKICWQITVAAFMQPLQYDLRDPAAKDNSITNAATARSNLDAPITMRSAETELQNTIELRATASEIVAPKPDLDARAEKLYFWSVFNEEFK